MKICILTQPLGHNYGGIMQNYALQTVLKRMGHEVWTEDRKVNKVAFLSQLKRVSFIRFLFGKKKITSPSSKQEAIIQKYTRQFIKKNIQTTVPIYSKNKKKLLQYNFDAYVVGSDQVWRPCYSYGLYNYFLDFTKGLNVKRFAYAASFGVDNWEFTEKQTKECEKFVKQFDLISVREYSGIGLCESYLGVEADHVLDPTLLLEKEDYISLINLENKSKNGLYTYLLDDSEEKNEITNKLCSKFKLSVNTVMPKIRFKTLGKNPISKCTLASVSDWLSGFYNADFVFTDSFHGTIFSIIFNKQFITIANKDRGIARFSSLLKMFGLEDRLIFSINDLTDSLICNHIDYDTVNKQKNHMKKISMNFLSKI